MQTKMTDLEAWSRRNNIRLYVIPEGEEENNMMNFVAKLLKSELDVPDVVNLKIQRCHRAGRRRRSFTKAKEFILITTI